MKKVKIYTDKSFSVISGNNVLLYNLLFKTEKFVMSSSSNCDCAIFSGITSFKSLLKFFNLFLRRKRIVYRLDGPYHGSGLVFLMNKYFSLILLKKTSGIIFQSSLSRLLWTSKYPQLLMKRHKIIPNFSVVPQSIVRNSSKKGECGNVIIVGRNSKMKRIESTLELLNMLSDDLNIYFTVHLISSYKPNKEYRYEILQYEHVNHNQVLETMSKCDLMFHLAAWDAFPNAVVEASEIGLPVIVSSLCGAADFIDPNLVVVESFEFNLENVPEMSYSGLKKAFENFLAGKYSINKISKETVLSGYLEMTSN